MRSIDNLNLSVQNASKENILDYSKTEITASTKTIVHKLKAPLDRFGFDDFLDADKILRKILQEKRKN